jgi:hypothetical protein
MMSESDRRWHADIRDRDRDFRGIANPSKPDIGA